MKIKKGDQFVWDGLSSEYPEIDCIQYKGTIVTVTKFDDTCAPGGQITIRTFDGKIETTCFSPEVIIKNPGGTPGQYKCHGCKGTGWVTVGQESVA